MDLDISPENNETITSDSDLSTKYLKKNFGNKDYG